MKNMHRVSDEDFDKLFKENLYSYEAAPTDAVWEGIKGQLKTVKRERSFPILRVAAASLASIIGLGIWLAATKEPMRLSGNSVDSPSSKIIEVPAISTEPQSQSRPKKAEPLKLVLNPERISGVRADVKVAKVKLKSAPSKEPVKQVDVVVHSDAGTKISSLRRTETVERPVSVSKPIANEVPVLALAEPMHQEDEPVIRDKKIKSVGSLVNFVVGKIDKRKEKIIEFEDSDEGTKVSGLNLGLLKIKAKE